MNRPEFEKMERAVDLAIERIVEKGSDDVFRPPIFSKSAESLLIESHQVDFRRDAKREALRFLRAADLNNERVGPTRRGLVTKDQHTFREVAWLDPFDAVKYLAVSLMVFEPIERSRLPKADGWVHSHRMSERHDQIFDPEFGYDSFRARSSLLSRERVGQWKVVTDISNFFDRIGNHTLENHLRDIGCDEKYVSLIREMLFFWAGDRRSYGVPVGSDASRILSEAVLLDVDLKMKDSGLQFVRYVDDYRIFAETRLDALKAVETLTSLLADEGLSLNSRKTSIFEIADPEEVAALANSFAGGEHEQIDLDEKIEVRKAVRVSGVTSISRFYREPGKEALSKIVNTPKQEIFAGLIEATDATLEQHIKLAVKYFVYADQDVEILQKLIEEKITAIFYICDALVKEAERFDHKKCAEIKGAIFDCFPWSQTAYPLQVPVIRVASHPKFLEPKFVERIVDSHLQTDNKLFFREAIALGAPCLDRSRLRKLAIEVFGNVPPFVQRAIFTAVRDHAALSTAEKRSLLKNMKQHGEDWFINRL
ncbi:RNA-directed DNA polymerase [Shimia sp. R9_1]|uniref:RNA-directed DNA polymerase n=1 Tax=Shimia sp. R9_1 TaxID=2821111 RepID=UPI001ADB2DF3|nr:RNA-directed DNA polymerase [Shimia sp. R9_1]MBO9408730.1 RNA-directed DNA polymerase [Shimia sp. R9_1]